MRSTLRGPRTSGADCALDIQQNDVRILNRGEKWFEDRRRVGEGGNAHAVAAVRNGGPGGVEICAKQHVTAGADAHSAGCRVGSGRNWFLGERCGG